MQTEREIDDLRRQIAELRSRIEELAKRLPPRSESRTTRDAPVVPTAGASHLEQTFRELAERWREETAVLSSLQRMVTNPAYQRIIGLGPAVVPLLLRELQREPDHWFWALSAITGENPAPPSATFDEAVAAWSAWGKARGLVA